MTCLGLQIIWNQSIMVFPQHPLLLYVTIIESFRIQHIGFEFFPSTNQSILSSLFTWFLRINLLVSKGFCFTQFKCSIVSETEDITPLLKEILLLSFQKNLYF